LWRREPRLGFDFDRQMLAAAPQQEIDLTVAPPI
jgi:hypothetical protein